MATLPLVLPRTPGSTQRDSSSGAGRSARRGPATTERRPRQSVTTVEPASVWPAHHHHRFRATWCPRRGHGRLLGWSARLVARRQEEGEVTEVRLPVRPATIRSSFGLARKIQADRTVEVGTWNPR